MSQKPIYNFFLQLLLVLVATSAFASGGGAPLAYERGQVPSQYFQGDNVAYSSVNEASDSGSHYRKVTLVAESTLKDLVRKGGRQEKEMGFALSADEKEVSIVTWIIAALLLLTLVGGLGFRSSYFINARLGVKLGLGFGSVLVLALFIGLGGYYFLNKVNNEMDLTVSALDLDMMASELNVLQNEFVLYGIADKEQGERILEEHTELVNEFATDIAEMQKGDLPPNERDVLDKIKQEIGVYEKHFSDLTGFYHTIEEDKEVLDEIGEEIDQVLELIIHEHEAELDDLQTSGRADYQQIGLQTNLVEMLLGIEVASLKTGHAEVEFLLDKNIDRIKVMEEEIGNVVGGLKAAKTMISKIKNSDTSRAGDLQKLTEMQGQVEHYIEKLGEIIIAQLTVQGDLVDTSESLHMIETMGRALADKLDADAEYFKTQANKATFMLLGVALLIGLATATFLTRLITRPIKKTAYMLDEMGMGHLDLRLKMNRSDEIGRMARTMDAFADDLQHVVVKALEQLAEGDLTFNAASKDDKDVIGTALVKTSKDLNSLVAEILVAIEQIASGSSQVADASQSLSQGASEQAASLEQITSSMTEMASQTKTNAENAGQANGLAEETRKAAERGQLQMQDMVVAMDEISESGKSISKIIKTIDEIAFQTNLLALNAAVEAARAGRHGKGFAVVAEEVRNLAARSAKAAQETAELIEGSVDKTNNGSAIASRTAEGLDEIVTSVGKVTDLVAEIAAASNEQAEGIGQVNIGITQIDQVTQQNTANAEEGASAAEELSSQSSLLKEMVSRFRLKDIGYQTSVAAPVQASPIQARIQAPLATETVDPTTVISLDDDDFGKF